MKAANDNEISAIIKSWRDHQLIFGIAQSQRFINEFNGVNHGLSMSASNMLKQCRDEMKSRMVKRLRDSMEIIHQRIGRLND